MQLSRLNWWDDFIKLTEDTQYTDCTGGDPSKLHRIAIIFVHCHPINIIWNVAKFSARRYILKKYIYIKTQLFCFQPLNETKIHGLPFHRKRLMVYGADVEESLIIQPQLPKHVTGGKS